jgi:hypothetical protein
MLTAVGRGIRAGHTEPPGIVVAEENVKTQISALRKALGGDRDFIQTDFGRAARLW